jgi:hypothetical protein
MNPLTQFKGATPIFLVALVCFGLSPVASADPVFSIETKLTASNALSFGHDVAISGDTAIVGAPLDGGGSAYVFVRNGGMWSQQQKLIASDAESADLFGDSVAISGDLAVVGASRDDPPNFSGSAYVFVRAAGVWTQEQKLLASDRSAGDEFGISVAIDGETIVVGADTSGSFSGSAYVFVRNGGMWTEQQKLTAADAPVGALFGSSVAISGDTAVIGARLDGTLGFDAGSADVFVRSGAAWSQQQKLIANDAAFDSQFGNSVAISGDRALVGAFRADAPASNSGSAYLFVRSGSAWAQEQKLIASDAAADQGFGFFVDVDGDIAVIGSYLPIVPGQLGSAYAFIRSAGTWIQQQKIVSSDIQPGDGFGISVALSDTTLVVGSVDPGAAYVFEPDTTPPTITSASASPNTIWPPDHRMVPVTIAVTATDNSGAEPTCQIVSVSSNEPINGLGDGDTAPDWQVTGDLSVNLRAERSGTGNGRVYTLTIQCTDGSNNSSSAQTTVSVPHNR